RLAAIGGQRAVRHDLDRLGVGGLDVELDLAVEGALAERLGGQAAAAGCARELVGLGDQVGARDDAVDQSPGERGARVDRVAGHAELESAAGGGGRGRRGGGGGGGGAGRAGLGGWGGGGAAGSPPAG